MDMYKKKPIKFVNKRINREFMHSQTLIARESSRVNLQNEKRNIDVLVETKETTKKTARVEMLQKWKQEKQRKKELEIKNKKRTFYPGGSSGSQLPSLQQMKPVSFHPIKVPVNNKMTGLVTKTGNNIDKTTSTETFGKKINSVASNPGTAASNKTGCVTKTGSHVNKLTSIEAFGKKISNVAANPDNVASNKTGSVAKIRSNVNNTMGTETFGKKINSGTTKLGIVASNKRSSTRPGIQSLPKTKLTATLKPSKQSENCASKVTNQGESAENKIKKKFSDKMAVADVGQKQLVCNSNKTNGRKIFSYPTINEASVKSGYVIPSTQLGTPSSIQAKQVGDDNIQLNKLEQENQLEANRKNTVKQDLSEKLEIIELEEIKSTKEQLSLRQNPENIPDLTLNCDLSVIKAETSFAPLDFKFQPPAGLSTFLFDVDKVAETRSSKYILRTSTPTKEVCDQVSAHFSITLKSTVKDCPLINKEDYSQKESNNLFNEIITGTNNTSKALLYNEESLIFEKPPQKSLDKEDVHEQIENNTLYYKRDVEEKLCTEPYIKETEYGKVSSVYSFKEMATNNFSEEFIISLTKTLPNRIINDTENLSKVVLDNEELLTSETLDIPVSNKAFEEQEVLSLKEGLCKMSLGKIIGKEDNEQIGNNSFKNKVVENKLPIEPDTSGENHGNMSPEYLVKELPTSNQGKESVIQLTKILSHEIITDTDNSLKIVLHNEEPLTPETSHILVNNDIIEEEKEQKRYLSEKAPMVQESVYEQTKNYSLKKNDVETKLSIEPGISEISNEKVSCECSVKEIVISNHNKMSIMSLRRTLSDGIIIDIANPSKIVLTNKELLTSEVSGITVNNETFKENEELSIKEDIVEQIGNFSLNVREMKDGKVSAEFSVKEMPINNHSEESGISITKTLSTDTDNLSKLVLHNEDILAQETSNILVNNETFDQKEELIIKETLCEKSPGKTFGKEDVEEQIANYSLKKGAVKGRLPNELNIIETNDVKVSSEYFVKELPTNNQAEKFISMPETPNISQIEQVIEAQVQSIKLEQVKQGESDISMEKEISKYNEKSTGAISKRNSVCKKSAAHSVAGTCNAEDVVKSPVKTLKSLNSPSTPRRSLRLSARVSELSGDHTISPLKTIKSQTCQSTPQCALKLSVQRSKVSDNQRKLAIKEESDLISPAVPTRHSQRLLKSISKKHQFGCDVLSPFKGKKFAFFNFTSRRSPRPDFSSDGNENEIENTPAKSGCMKTNLTADFERLALHSDENIDPNACLADFENSPQTVFAVKSKKHSLFSLERRKSTRCGSKDRISFSPGYI